MGDVFSPVIVHDTSKHGAYGSEDAIGSGDVLGTLSREPLSPLINHQPKNISTNKGLLGSPWQPRSHQADVDAESEIWIDTDLDESEAGE